MRSVIALLRWLLLALNVLAVAGLVVSAWSSHVPAQAWPLLSCAGMVFPVFLAAAVVFVPLWALWRGRRRWVCLSLAGLLLVARSMRTYCPLNVPQPVPEGAVKVLTYNVYNLKPAGEGKEGGLHPCLDYVLGSGADVVCLQEVDRRQWSAADSLLGVVYPYRRCESWGAASCALLSRYPVVSAERIDYASEGNSSWAYRLAVGEDTLLVVNNHLESYRLGEEDRQEYKDVLLRPGETDVEQGVRGLIDKVAAANAVRGPQADSVAAYVEGARERYQIVCGDFNAPSISYPHYRLTRSLDDAFTRSGNGPGISYHLSGMYFRIDNILCSPAMKPFGARVDRSIEASDHYPMYCYVALR